MGLEYPSDLKYTESHEYVRLDGEIATIGISAFAVDQLGDIVFLELPEINDAVEKDQSIGTIESVKAVEELKSPVSGTVVDCNSEVVDSPELLTEDPYGEAWLLKVRVDDLTEIEGSYSAEEYQAMVEGE